MEIRDPIVDHLFTVADVAVAAVLVFTIALVLYDRVSHSIKFDDNSFGRAILFISVDITDHFATIQ
jgi:hypothetical protein